MRDVLRKIVIWVCESALVAPYVREVTIETWSREVSKLSTPDQLISAAIVNSLAKDYDDWQIKFNALRPNSSSYGNHRHFYGIELLNNKTEVHVKFDPKWEGGEYSFESKKIVDVLDATVNGVAISVDDARFIYQSLKKLVEERKKLAEAAAKAKAEMEANEAKWQIAERLLKMRRNEFGALVPIEDLSTKEDYTESVDIRDREGPQRSTRNKANTLGMITIEDYEYSLKKGY